jgi:alpha-1,3-glucosyltransferase
VEEEEEEEESDGEYDNACHAGAGGGNVVGGPASPLMDLVALHTSRWGYEDVIGKMYMRFTVLISDVLVYFTAVWVLISRLATSAEDDEKDDDEDANGRTSVSSSTTRDAGCRSRLLLVALCQPAIILVDHGHFQYNTVSLGLALWSFHHVTITNPMSFVNQIFGSVLFVLALNFKQMELYHAPAIFAYLLGRCFRRDYDDHRRGTAPPATMTLFRFMTLGMTVVFTFATLWLPFAIYPRNEDDVAGGYNLDGPMQILRRLFPFQRGIFEGKVANVWCAMSVRPFSIRDRIPPTLLPYASLFVTLTLIVPPCWMLFRVGRGDHHPTRPRGLKGRDDDARLLLWGTASTSLAFFLASYQVHEKGILIPLAPISMLMVDAPRFVVYFSIAATWSLWPLLVIDRLTDAYVCCLVIFLCIDGLARMAASGSSSYEKEMDMFSDAYITRHVPALSWILMIMLHLLDLLFIPPQHLPDLFPVLWSLGGCGLFCIAYLGTLWAMAKGTNPSKYQGKMEQPRAKRKVASTSSIPMIHILGALLVSCPRESEGFILPSLCCQNNVRTISRHIKLRESSTRHDIDGFITQDLVHRAQSPLEWERRNAQEAKPVLNLSARDFDSLSPAMRAVEDGTLVEDEADWTSGHLWQVTEQHLTDIGILSSTETTRHILTMAPQLLRMPTSQIVEAARFLMSYPCGANSTAVIEGDPSLLTYLANDLQYGLEEYLPNMMFLGNATLAAQMIETQLKLSPTFALRLIRMGVDGGLEERVRSKLELPINLRIYDLICLVIAHLFSIVCIISVGFSCFR